MANIKLGQGTYYYNVSYVFTGERKWIGKRTPQPFEEGQYLVNANGSWHRVTEVQEKVVNVINQHCVITGRPVQYVRDDIKDGTIRQLTPIEWRVHRMLYG